MEEIKVKYFVEDLEPLTYVADKSDWIDLRAAETVTLRAGEFRLIPLGVAIALPEGYEAHIVPRSSTFRNYGILQTNSMGVVDYSYRGDNDQWHMPAYATRDVTIEKNARICQFRIVRNQPHLTLPGWSTWMGRTGAASAPRESEAGRGKDCTGLRLSPPPGAADAHGDRGL